MANPIYKTISATGVSYTLLDWAQSPFNVSWALEFSGGVTGSATVLYTLDDLNDSTFTPIWFVDPINGGAITASVAGNYLSPIRALQVNVASLAGGKLRLAVLQGSSAR